MGCASAPAGSAQTNECQLSEEAAGRRRGRSVEKLRNRKRPDGKITGAPRWKPEPGAGRANEIHLRNLGQEVGFLLRFLALGDDLTEIAGVRAVEGFRNRFTEGSVTHIRYQHGRPGDRLQSQPVQT